MRGLQLHHAIALRMARLEPCGEAFVILAGHLIAFDQENSERLGFIAIQAPERQSGCLRLQVLQAHLQQRDAAAEDAVALQRAQGPRQIGKTGRNIRSTS